MSQIKNEVSAWSPLRLQREHLLNNLLTLVTMLFWSRVILYAFEQKAPRGKYGAIFLGGGILIYILNELYKIEENKRFERIGLWLCAVIGVGTSIHVLSHYQILVTTRVGYALPREYALGGLFTLVVLSLTYRAFGAAFASVVLLTIVYTLYGNTIPGLLGHGGISETQIINILTMEFNGFFGSITQIVAAEVALFLLYAGLMRGFGAFQLIMRLALKTATYLRSGVAQSAVLSSLVMGSINGAQTANAAMTGSFTIPLMKNSGMKGESAGGVEAVASSGGQIMPPVMGAAAFVMASLLPDVGYVGVLIAGIIPALVFYISVVIGVHYMSVKQLSQADINLDEKTAELDDGYHPLIEVVRFGLPFAMLLYTLGIAQWTVISSALYTCAVMILVGAGIPILLSCIRSEDDLVTTSQKVINDTISGLKFGAITVAPIAIVIASVNGIVDLLNATGIPGKLSLMLVSIAGGVMLFTVIIAMIICLILGLGMPTVAAYTIVALLIAPTLTSQFNVPSLSAHFFVFYAAILSGLTPPIAISVVVTAGIAESNFWKTCSEALKLATPLFILPFTFIYNPEIVTGGFTLRTGLSGLILLLSAIAIIHGINCAPKPFGISSPLSYGVRAIYVTLGILGMVWPPLMTRAGIVLIAIILIAVQNWVPPFSNIESILMDK